MEPQPLVDSMEPQLAGWPKGTAGKSGAQGGNEEALALPQDRRAEIGMGLWDPRLKEEEEEVGTFCPQQTWMGKTGQIPYKSPPPKKL